MERGRRQQTRHRTKSEPTRGGCRRWRSHGGRRAAWASIATTPRHGAWRPLDGACPKSEPMRRAGWRWRSHASRTDAWANKATHAARWRHVVSPRSSLTQNKRTEAAGRAPLAAAMATGALTRRAARADTQQAPIAPAIQLLPAFCLWGGFCVCETHWGGRYRRANDIATGGGSPSRSRPRSAAAVWRRKDERKATQWPECV